MAFQQKRLTVLFLFLFLTLLVAWFAPKPPNTVQPIDRAAGTARGLLPANSRSLEMVLPQTILAIEPRTFVREENMFLHAMGAVPSTPIPPRKLPLRPTPQTTIPITVAVSPIPPSPDSTSLPFKVLGYVILNGEITVLLQYLNQTFAVKTDDTILKQYKVEAINTNQMTIRNLNLNQVQVVQIQ